MNGDEKEVTIVCAGYLNTIKIPIKSVFQVKRGLESYIQRFYRIKKK